MLYDPALRRRCSSHSPNTDKVLPRIHQLTSLSPPDYTNTQPPVDILHNLTWDDKWKIVSIDPYGHLAPTLFKSYLDAGPSFLPLSSPSARSLLCTGIDVRPTIAITKAHIKLIDIDEAVRSGSLEVDGKIVVKCPTEWIAANKAKSEEAKTARGEGDVAAAPVPYASFDAGVELNVSKAALEPVWYLPGASFCSDFRRSRANGASQGLRSDSGSPKVR